MPAKTPIETEKLLAQLVETEMNRCLKEDTYKGKCPMKSVTSWATKLGEHCLQSLIAIMPTQVPHQFI